MSVKNGDVINKDCNAYFKGRDHIGTCNIKCQWYVKGKDCIMWKSTKKINKKRQV